MSDPWKMTRLLFDDLRAPVVVRDDPVRAAKHLRELLADADALLALVIPAQEAFDYFEADYDQPEWFMALERALSGLSAHLKGE